MKSFYALRAFYDVTPRAAEFHLCAFLVEALRVASNNAKRHVMEYRGTYKDVWQFSIIGKWYWKEKLRLFLLYLKSPRMFF